MTNPYTDDRAEVSVDVAPVWSSPDAPRTLDQPVTDSSPDHRKWLADLDDESRLSLLGRLETEALRGEPVVVLERVGEWCRVELPLQPSSKGSVGYPGFVLAGHLGGQADSSSDAQPPSREDTGSVAAALVTQARKHLGLAYLWGGLSDAGLDCSGLVHLSHRRVGLVIPRDADDQALGGVHIPREQAEVGDLLFFDNGHGVHHVAMYTGQGNMIHSPRTGWKVEEIAVEDFDLHHELVDHVSRYSVVNP